MARYWAIDLGTTNTVVAAWDEEADGPMILRLEGLTRPAAGRLDPPAVVPSAVFVREPQSLADRLGRWRFFAGRCFWGCQGLIGQPALERQQGAGGRARAFAASFKPLLGRNSQQPVAQTARRAYSVRQVAQVFLRELLAAIQRQEGVRLREAVFTVPVGSFETYREELRRLAQRLGVRRCRTLDEPVAAALGYGLSAEAERTLLVVDFGGGTLDVAVVRTGETPPGPPFARGGAAASPGSPFARGGAAASPGSPFARGGTETPPGSPFARGGSRSPLLTKEGPGEVRAMVLAKEGEPLGGDHVDVWLLEEYCRRLGFDLSDQEGDWYRRFWRRAMLDEAQRVKEELHREPQATFHLEPTDELRALRLDPQDARTQAGGTFRREELGELLEERGLYRTLDEVLDRVEVEAARRLDPEAARRVKAEEDLKKITRDRLDEVLLVGGSTLLPGVQPLLERRYRRDRLRDWLPFEAVAYGACTHAAGQAPPADFIHHDYALLIIDPVTGQEKYPLIIPRGTRYPTRPDFFTDDYVPACPRGTPEKVFELLICEIGRAHGGHREFFWDAHGVMHVIEAGDKPVIVKLNEADPTLGRLNPPHPPGDKSARLRVQFGVNEDRWLCATVFDLLTRRTLMEQQPVVRLR